MMAGSIQHNMVAPGIPPRTPGAEASARSDDKSGRSSPMLRLPSRSPHPYHRRKREVSPVATSFPSSPYDDLSLVRSGHIHEDRRSTGADTPARAHLISPSESGTEADDEKYTLVKALPAPPSRPRKGLRITQSAVEGREIPLLTPERPDDVSRRFIDRDGQECFVGESVNDLEDDKAAQAKAVRRRRAELLRRVSEIAFMVCLESLVLFKQRIWWNLSGAERAAVVSHAVVVLSACLSYPARLVSYYWQETTLMGSIRGGLRFSAAFDPAIYIYPTLLPVAVALSLHGSSSGFLMVNILLGLSGLPQHLISTSIDVPYSSFHWLISLIPLVLAEKLCGFASSPVSEASILFEILPREVLVSLFPLHQVLVPFLHSFTTTSLLPAELQLLSMSLINILLFASSPHITILSIILWVGGLGVYLLCSPFILWGIALARIPRWRFKRAGRVIQARNSFISALTQNLKDSISARQRPDIVESDADDDDALAMKRHSLGLEDLKRDVLNSLKESIFWVGDEETRSAVENSVKEPISPEPTGGAPGSRPKRRNTLPITHRGWDGQERPKRKRRRPLTSNFFLSLTSQQANLRKWFYAGALYLVMILLVLAPIRILIARYALHNSEPFGWAIGYLLGDLREVRFWIVSSNLERWIPLPPLQYKSKGESELLGRAGYFRQILIGVANTRLVISAYCIGILMLGMATVLSLTATVEVDTRRKTFHGMMVAMMLPTIYIDPTFIALALVLVLSIFLILDLLRASQLPPLSKPLASFLAPYVDGRDLRGPVVISHIFLLIGCAVPLWLSLAGTQLTGDYPWSGWEATTRDTSLVAGVVCVGMGDAAASLVGRRYGRHKWIWSGGKSLEGSAAFAVAVSLGISFGKLWLVLGGWNEPVTFNPNAPEHSWLKGRITTLAKILLSACGASFNEAVLTGGNDNVVVPVVLWLLVRGLGV